MGAPCEGQCFGVVLLCKAAAVWWFRRFVLPQPRATSAALAAAAPIWLLNTTLLFALDATLCGPGVMSHAAAVLAWVCNFKVLAYVTGRGPTYSKCMGYWEVFGALATPASLALPTDEGYAATKKADDLPVKAPTNGKAARDRPAGVVVVTEDPLRATTIIRTHLKLFVTYVSLIAAIWTALKHSGRLRLPVWAIQGLYGAGFLTCHLLSHVPWECLSSLLARRPPIHNAWRPWAPKSVADFWGVRWNRTGSAILRWVVYEPVTTGLWLAPPGVDQRPLLRAAPAWRRMLAALGTFLASGLVHELIWWSMTKSVFGWFLPYFLANGLVVVGEGLLQQTLAAPRRSHPGSSHGKQQQQQQSRGAPAADVHCTAGAAQTAAANGSSKSTGGLAAARSAPLDMLAGVVAQLVRSAVVFTVVMGLGGVLVWPHLAPAIGESFMGRPGISFTELHAHLTGQ